MCPGLTHKNVVDELAQNPVPKDVPVAILAEGKELSLASVSYLIVLVLNNE